MQKNVLLIYYSQSGQGKAIAESVLKPLRQDSETQIDEYEIKARKPYPFPWPSDAFFDCMPESVKGAPCELISRQINTDTNYNLIIISYPVWYLSPAIPVASFMQSETARQISNNRNIITISGLRNMGAEANEAMREYIAQAGGKQVGNIALRDTENNLVSVLTIIRWLMKGRKEASKHLPEAGVKQADIKAAQKFGTPVLQALKKNQFDRLNAKLTDMGANKISYAITNMELKAKKMFRIWADFIQKKGEAGSKKRLARVRAFKYYLLTVIFLISPAAGLVFNIQKALSPGKARRTVKHYQSTCRGKV